MNSITSFISNSAVKASPLRSSQNIRGALDHRMAGTDTVHFGSAALAFQPQSDPFIPAATPPMNEFINLATYNESEHKHAGWVLANALKKGILLSPLQRYGCTTSRPRILEIGCSSGTSTIPIASRLTQADANNGEAYELLHAIDIDPQAIALLNDKLKDSNTNPDGKVQAMVADAMRFTPPDGKPYTHAVMQFSLSHFDAAGKSYLLDHLEKIMDSIDLGPISCVQRDESTSEVPDRPSQSPLRKTGFLLITDEFLPKFHDDASEKQALWKHHGAVIFDALIKGNMDLAELELEALHSGVHKTGDFKISCEEFEDMLWRKGMRCLKYKAFPLNPDLTPYEMPTAETPQATKERQAIDLWHDLSPKLFEAVKQNGGKLSDEARAILKQIGQRFAVAKVDSLRTTPQPDDIQLDGKGVADYQVQKRETEANNWGVYTYRIHKSRDLDNIKHFCTRMSEVLKGVETVSEGVARLQSTFGKKQGSINYYANVIDRFPAMHWYSALGEELPTYHDLHYNPQVRQEWERKVKLSKEILWQYELMGNAD